MLSLLIISAIHFFRFYVLLNKRRILVQIAKNVKFFASITFHVVPYFFIKTKKGESKESTRSSNTYSIIEIVLESTWVDSFKFNFHVFIEYRSYKTDVIIQKFIKKNESLYPFTHTILILRC